MAFELRVTFAGLLLYVHRSENDDVAIYMPDCRRHYANPQHADGKVGEAHVGYLRANFACVDNTVPAPAQNKYGVPSYELIHRFTRQQLDFGLPHQAGIVANSINVPKFAEFAPTLKPLAGLDTATPPKVLLTRMLLSGGDITGQVGGKTWTIPKTLHPAPAPPDYAGQWAGFVTWTRQVDAANLAVTFSDFDGANPYTRVLEPVMTATGPAVELKIANLCADNTLEWSELSTRLVTEDRDFKWLYRLLGAHGVAFHEIENGAELPFPFTSGPQPFGGEDCMGGQIKL